VSFDLADGVEDVIHGAALASYNREYAARHVKTNKMSDVRWFFLPPCRFAGDARVVCDGETTRDWVIRDGLADAECVDLGQFMAAPAQCVAHGGTHGALDFHFVGTPLVILIGNCFSEGLLIGNCFSEGLRNGASRGVKGGVPKLS